MANFLTQTNIARIAKVLALLFFVLPWVTVSCADQTLVSMTGLDMATGHINMAANPLAEAGASMPTPASHGGDLFVILGAVLILAALAASFILKGRTGALAGMAGSAAAALCLAYAVLVRIPGAARADIAASAGGTGSGAGSPSPEQIAQMIRVNVEIGFYLCLLALIAAVVFNFLAMRSAPPTAAPPDTA